MKQLTHISATLKKYMYMKQMTQKELGLALGVGETTMRLRMQNPGQFTVRELQLAIDRLHIPADELFMCFQADEKTSGLQTKRRVQ